MQRLLEAAQLQYRTYMYAQAIDPDPEFVELMTVAANAEDDYWEKKWGWRKGFKQEVTLNLDRDAETVVVEPKPAKTTEAERDARMFEEGADWLEKRGRAGWTRGWQTTFTLPDGRFVDARCALGTILAARYGGVPDPAGYPDAQIERALERVGLESGNVMTWNDEEVQSFEEVVKGLRGIAYKIREGV